MNILIDCTNLKVGGGIQVATSFINDLRELDLVDKFIVVLSPQMKNVFDRKYFPVNILFIDLPLEINTKVSISKFLLSLEVENLIDKVFCVFGPSYYKSKAPKIVGYALPHFIYKESDYFKGISFKAKFRLFLMEKLQVYLFKKNSDKIIFETEDARNRFVNSFSFIKETKVVNNTINEIFSNESKWEIFTIHNSSVKKILCLSANYPHKNIKIIPSVIDELLSIGLLNFKFYLTINKSDFYLDERYLRYIEFLGKVDLNKIPSLYQQMDILFMPTLLEVFSATYLEAMYMKIPIVASDMSFARDVCGDSAFYYKSTNAEMAAIALQKVLTNETIRKELVNNGVENLKRFGSSMDRTKKYLKIIKV